MTDSGVAEAAVGSLPLCVDLDGTLIRTDLLWETLVLLLARRPWLAPMPFIWMLSGKARLKSELASRASIDPALLPYDDRVIAFLTAQKAAGRKLVLATAANKILAESIARHLGLFDEVICSDEHQNLRGDAKGTVLQARFGPFAYLGNAHADFPVWSKAAAADIANAAPRVLSKLSGERTVGTVIPRQGSRMRGMIKVLRPYQWSKNLLAFVPIITSDQPLSVTAWWQAFLVAVAFSATASAIYVLNDLTDLAADRAHPRKRRRPFASGSLPLPFGFVLVPLLLGAGFAIAADIHVIRLLSVYLAVSLAYTFQLKEQPLVDVFALAFLYLIRLYAGGSATGHYVSMWLLGFSAFLFLGLALMKRTSELVDAGACERQVLRRGYGASDLPVLRTMGISASFVSSMLLALYFQSPEVAARHLSPDVLWLLVPLLLFWQARMWLSSARGRMHDDPIVAAARDWVTWGILISVLVTILAADRL